MTKSLTESSELRKINLTVQFWNGRGTILRTKVVEAPHYKALRKEHPQYRSAIDNAIADLAEAAGLPRHERPVMTQIH